MVQIYSLQEKPIHQLPLFLHATIYRKSLDTNIKIGLQEILEKKSPLYAYI